MSILITPGQAGDNPQLVPLLDQIRVAPRRTGPAPEAARPGDRRQGLLAPLDPPSAAAARICFTCPETLRPDRPTHGQGLSRRPATGLRRRRLPGPQRRRTLLQPAQAVPRPGHPLRQTRSPTTAPNSPSPPSSSGSANTNYRTRPSRRVPAARGAAAVGHLPRAVPRPARRSNRRGQSPLAGELPPALAGRGGSVGSLRAAQAVVLLTGPALHMARAAAARIDPSESEREFLEASRKRNDEEATQEPVVGGGLELP